MRLRSALLILPMFLSLAVCLLGASGCAHRRELEQSARMAEPVTGLLPGAQPHVPVVQPINDPIERFNRTMFGFNDVMIDWVLAPLETGYRAIAPEGFRRSVSKFGNNLKFPVRLLSNLFQGKPKAAAVETGRFVTNTTVGLLGFFDPARRLGMRPYDEDFGQTFGKWGSGPGFYLVLPFMGPTNGRDALGKIPDTAFSLGTYIPGAGLVTGFNDLSFVLPGYQRLAGSQLDVYALARDYQAIDRKAKVVDFTVSGDVEGGIAPEPSMQAVFLRVEEEDFPDRAEVFEARITATGRKLPYSLWLQRGPAPLMYVLPGIGAHRHSVLGTALAELAYNQGFSVAIISNAACWEFVERAATVKFPGYVPQDAMDVYHALGDVDFDIARRFPGRVSERVLLGISLGGLHTLHLAADEIAGKLDGLRFDRYVSVDAPPELAYAVQQLDAFHDVALEWPAEERWDHMQNALLKASSLVGAERQRQAQSTVLPFSQRESRYLIGLAFRLILRDVYYVTRDDAPAGAFGDAGRGLRREPLYEEIEKYGFYDYFRLFVGPYYAGERQPHVGLDRLLADGSLRAIAPDLARNAKIRIFANESDFLLKREDVGWLRETFGQRVTVFSSGGHGGGLSHAEVQEAIIETLREFTERP